MFANLHKCIIFSHIFYCSLLCPHIYLDRRSHKCISVQNVMTMQLWRYFCTHFVHWTNPFAFVAVLFFSLMLMMDLQLITAIKYCCTASASAGSTYVYSAGGGIQIYQTCCCGYLSSYYSKIIQYLCFLFNRLCLIRVFIFILNIYFVICCVTGYIYIRVIQAYCMCLCSGLLILVRDVLVALNST